MCRWMGYSGSPVLLEELLIRPKHSLVVQSLSSTEGVENTNGDGFGVGWYADAQSTPGVYKSPQPGWNDRNLSAIAKHIRSPMFLAHARATTGTPVQQTNCHPFDHERWLFVHNGLLRGYEQVKRALVLEVDPKLYYGIEGTTDSELMFNLALTFGLEKEPKTALERMTGLVEKIGNNYGVSYPVQMTLGLSNGAQLFAVRYSSEHQSRSLYHSKNMQSLQQLHPELLEFSADACAVVSEPLNQLSDEWAHVPESSWVEVNAGDVSVQPFHPKLP
jgi:predicted glutamine amidotransferase